MRTRAFIWILIGICIAMIFVGVASAERVRDERPGATPETTPQGIKANWARLGLDLTPTVQPTIPPPRPIPIRLEGIITFIPPTRLGEWRIDETVITVNAQTTILPEGYIPQVGDYATVNATRVGSVITAERIRIRVDSSDVRPVEFQGLIIAFPPPPYTGTWVISGVRVIVQADTTRVSGVPPALGFLAQVQGYVQPNRTVNALQVHVVDPSSILAKFEFQGTVERMSDSLPGIWVIGGVRGLVGEGTRIVGPITVGTQVEVSGRRLLESILVFEQIRVLSEEEHEVRLAGVIRQIAETYWIIHDIQRGDVRIEIDDSTFVDESRGRAAPGMWADVIARRQGQRLYALRIRVERFAQ